MIIDGGWLTRASNFRLAARAGGGSTQLASANDLGDPAYKQSDAYSSDEALTLHHATASFLVMLGLFHNVEIKDGSKAVQSLQLNT